MFRTSYGPMIIFHPHRNWNPKVAILSVVLAPKVVLPQLFHPPKAWRNYIAVKAGNAARGPRGPGGLMSPGQSPWENLSGGLILWQWSFFIEFYMVKHRENGKIKGKSWAAAWYTCQTNVAGKSPKIHESFVLYSPVNSHKQWQIGFGGWVSTQHGFSLGSISMYQRVIVLFFQRVTNHLSQAHRRTRHGCVPRVSAMRFRCAPVSARRYSAVVNRG